MTIERLKQILNSLPETIDGVPTDQLEIVIRNSVNPFGNIADLEQIERSSYGSFGKDIPCLIFNTGATNKKLETFEGYCAVDYEEDSVEYTQNLAIQKKIFTFLSTRVDDATIFRYLKKQIPGTLSEVDYLFIMKILTELTGEFILKEQFELNREKYLDMILNFDLEQTKKGK